MLNNQSFCEEGKAQSWYCIQHNLLQVAEVLELEQIFGRTKPKKKGSEKMNYVWRNNPSIVARLVNTKRVQTISNQETVLKPNEAVR